MSSEKLSIPLSSSIVVAVFIVIATNISVIQIGSSQSQITIAQQQQQQSQANQTSSVRNQKSTLEGSYFEIENMTFSHHMTSVNGIQLHYVIGGQGNQ